MEVEKENFRSVTKYLVAQSSLLDKRIPFTCIYYKDIQSVVHTAGYSDDLLYTLLDKPDDIEQFFERQKQLYSIKLLNNTLDKVKI